MTTPSTDDLLESQPPTGVDDTIRDELPCACGYDLRGLERTGRCPECGEEVAVAIRWNADPFGTPAVVRRMVRGLAIVQLAYVAWVVVLFLRGFNESGDRFAYWLIGASGPKSFIVMTSRPRVSLNLLVPLCHVVHLVGVWLLTTPHTRGRVSALRPIALTLRWTSIAALLLCFALYPLWTNRYVSALGCTSLADAAVGALWGIYLTGIAWKLGDARGLRMGGWIVAIGSAVFGAVFAAVFILLTPQRPYWETILWTSLSAWTAVGMLCAVLVVLTWRRLRRELRAGGTTSGTAPA